MNRQLPKDSILVIQQDEARGLANIHSHAMRKTMQQITGRHISCLTYKQAKALPGARDILTILRS